MRYEDENLQLLPDKIQPLIRCKDCKYYTEPDSHGDRCDKIHWSRGTDWFCADGKKQDGREYGGFIEINDDMELAELNGGKK